MRDLPDRSRGGRRDDQLEARYHTAQASYRRAQRALREAQRTVARIRPEARAAERRLPGALQREQRRVDRAERHDERLSIVRRLAVLLAALAGAYALLGRLRRRSRYLATAMACVAAVAVLALVMGVDYLTD